MITIEGMTPKRDEARLLDVSRGDDGMVHLWIHKDGDENGGWAIRVRPEQLTDALRNEGILVR